jgi:alanine racemase
VSLPRVWAEIDLGAFAHNLRRITGRAGPGVETILVLKADAYGHGALPLAEAARKLGIRSFGVGTLAEARELQIALDPQRAREPQASRELEALGPDRRILVLGTIVDDEAAAALRNEVEIALHSSDRRRLLQELASRQGLIARVHLKIDTGLGRLGVMPHKALELLDEIEQSSHLELAGVMTHMAAPDGALSEHTHEQLALFDEILAQARERKLLRGWIHAANSACIFTGAPCCPAPCQVRANSSP